MRRGLWGLVLVLAMTACGTGVREVAIERAPDAPTTTTSTSTTTTTASTTTVAPTTSAPPATTAPPTTQPTTTTATPPVAAVASVDTGTIEAYRGFGAWLDRFDWSAEWVREGNQPVVSVASIDHMAAEGVETIYIQTSYWEDPVGVIEPGRLRPLIDRAHEHGISVIGWYLPAFVDPAKDMEHVVAMHRFGVDGVAIDIEGTQVEDVPERSRRLVAFSEELRRRFPGLALGGIVLEPVLIEDLSDTYWPDFPWTEIAPYYDVWMPMNYWTNRRGEWRSAYRYMATNIDRVRQNLGLTDALVHPIGGIGDKTTEQDLHEMVQAAGERGAIGGSIYDYATSRAEFWPILRAFQAG